MPEGHTVHRLAAALDELFGGQRLRAASPQGRFERGAALLDGRVLLGAHAHGKHLFLPFGEDGSIRAALPAGAASLAGGALEADPSIHWLRIHLGLYGSWTFDGDSAFTAPHSIGAPRRKVGERGEHALRGGGGSALAGLKGGDAGPGDSGDAAGGAGAPAPGEWEPPEPRGAVRLRLEGEHGVADLTGPATCEVLDAEGVAAVRRRLGPDPLRADGDKQVFIASAKARRKAVGELLMDQSILAGVGNIYRAETLFRCGISPFRAGARVSEARLGSVWDDLVPLMEYGVATGFITTVDADDVPVPLPEDDPEAGRWYVYHRTGRPCLRCGTPIAEREVAGRRLFWCPRCQRA